MYEQLALQLMFGQTSYTSETILPVLTEHKLQYRKGRTISDIILARQKVFKQRMYRTEFELSMFELYLKDVLKPLKSVK